MMRLATLRSSSEYRRRSQGNISLDPATMSHLNQLSPLSLSSHLTTNRRRSVMDSQMHSVGMASYHRDPSRRASTTAVPSLGRIRSGNRLLFPVSGNARRGSLSSHSSIEENSNGEKDVSNLKLSELTHKVDEDYDLNLYRIKVLAVCFVACLLISLFIACTRFGGYSRYFKV